VGSGCAEADRVRKKTLDASKRREARRRAGGVARPRTNLSGPRCFDSAATAASLSMTGRRRFRAAELLLACEILPLAEFMVTFWRLRV
jgi:hypothetical protein